MSLPPIFEVVVGLVVVYYILGAVVSTVTQIVTESLETRGAALEKYLLQMAGDKTVDLTNLPQIKALRPIRYANWWSCPGIGRGGEKGRKDPGRYARERLLRCRRVDRPAEHERPGPAHHHQQTT